MVVRCAIGMHGGQHMAKRIHEHETPLMLRHSRLQAA